jgi:hypothetical protein
MTRQPTVGMRVAIKADHCCRGKHREGDVGTIVELIGHDFAVKCDSGTYWHGKECVNWVRE